jgi:hypothetical protein
VTTCTHTTAAAATATAVTAGEDGLVEELEAVGVKCVREDTGASPSMTEAQFMNFNIDPEVSKQPCHKCVPFELL